MIFGSESTENFVSTKANLSFGSVTSDWRYALSTRFSQMSMFCGLAPARKGVSVVSLCPCQKGRENQTVSGHEIKYNNNTDPGSPDGTGACAGIGDLLAGKLGRTVRRYVSKKTGRRVTSSSGDMAILTAPKNVAFSFRRCASERLMPAIRGCDYWLPLSLRIPEDPSHFKFYGTVLEIWTCG